MTVQHGCSSQKNNEKKKKLFNKIVGFFKNLFFFNFLMAFLFIKMLTLNFLKVR